MTDKHEHVWENGAVVREDRCSYSPKSKLDDILYVAVLQVQTCECGKVRRLNVGTEKERFRGDDIRRASGLRPLGNLPGSNG